MHKYDYLIVGGGIAGITAAETIREAEPRSTIAVISAEQHVLYSRVMLPSYLKKSIPREKLFLRTIDQFTERRIDLFLETHASFIDTRYKEVGLVNRASIDYQKLLVASGVAVRPWGISAPPEFLYRLQTLDDADRLYAALPALQSPVVIGGSFIALEFLEIFTKNELTPILLVNGPHFFDVFLDADGGALLLKNFEAHGIKVHYNDSVTHVVKKEDMCEVRTRRLQRVSSNALAVGIGVDRAVGFLSGSGIELGACGVKTNEFLETNVAGVFAAGDVAEFYDVISGEHHSIGNWTNAFLQGRRAGLTMVGRKEPFINVSSYSISNFGLQITAVGYCDNQLDAVTRIDPARKQYERFFLRDGVLVGAALINRFQDKNAITKLIERRTNVGEYRDRLADFGFDIGSITAV